VTTVIANAMRIVIALEIQRRSVEVSGLTENQLHRLEGIVVYFTFLMLLFVVIPALTFLGYLVAGATVGSLVTSRRLSPPRRYVSVVIGLVEVGSFLSKMLTRNQ